MEDQIQQLKHLVSDTDDSESDERMKCVWWEEMQ